MTILDIKKKYSKLLDFLDLDLIIAHFLEKPREFVLAHPEKIITKKQKKVIIKLIKRRAKHEPLAYILGHKEFYGLDFKVNKNVLIPRPETELIVDLVLKEIQNINYKIKKIKIIDIGTGSGNIIIAIAKNLLNQKSRIKNYVFYGTDISAKALTAAKYNAKINKVYKNIKFIHSNLLKSFIIKLKIINQKSKIIITANLPYGWLAWKNNSSAETIGIRFEPPIALFTGKNGLELYEKFLSQLLFFKKNGQDILVLFEIDPRQRINIKKLIKKHFPDAKTKFHKDLAGKWRVVKIRL